MYERPLRIIQISDCHVAADPKADYRGQNADHNLSVVLNAACDWNPDVIIATGDVSEDGSAESYQRVSEQLALCQVPVLALPGNHDKPQIMRDYFPAGPWDGPYLAQMKGWRLVLLDSTEEGRIAGILSPATLEWLAAELVAGNNRHHFLALHHQPVAVGAPWIDRYRLESPEAFLGLVDGASSVGCVTWGHIHHDFQLDRSGTTFLGTPSTVANSLPGCAKFTLDPAGPACRWYQLYSDGMMETGLL